MHICVLLSLADDGFESADEFPDGSENAIAVMVNSNAQIIYCNGNFVRMTGLSLDEVMGRNWSAAAHAWELAARSTGRGAEFILSLRVNPATRSLAIEARQQQVTSI
jgi:PAS domain-containing protein